MKTDNCPARVAPIGRQIPTGELLPATSLREHLRELARAMLLVVLVMAIAGTGAALLLAR